MIGVLFKDDDQETHFVKTHLKKDIGLCAQIVMSTPQSMVNQLGGPMHSVKKSTNMHFP